MELLFYCESQDFILKSNRKSELDPEADFHPESDEEEASVSREKNMCDRLSEGCEGLSGLDRRAPEPELRRVKEEVGFCSSEGATGPRDGVPRRRWEQLGRGSKEELQREDGGTRARVTVKTDEDEAQGPPTGRSSLPHQLGSLSPDSDTDDSEDWRETSRARSRPGPAGEKTDAPSGAPLSCPECGKVYKYKLSLAQHSRTCEGKQSSCPFCDKMFSHYKTLKEHLNFHTGEKLFPCKLCDMKFTKQVRLNAHMRTHTGEKPFCCSVCGKCFPKSDTLKRHMRCHTGEKPVSCSVCGRSFTENSNLKNHMRIHTGEKPYSCSECGRSFPKSDSLKRHMKVHTGATPVLCSLCGKSFTERGNLKRHMKTHAQVKVATS